MQPEPSVTAPTRARSGGVAFVVAAVGALLIGIGSLLTWVTVGFRGFTMLDTSSVGTDLADGRIAFACAVIALIGLLAMWFVAGARARRILAFLVAAASLVAAVVAVFFLVTAANRFGPITDNDLIGRLADALHQPVETVRDQLRQVEQAVGGFTKIGVGPVVTLIGGLLGCAGGAIAVLGMRGSAAVVAVSTAGD